ncbi:hypothetical protein K814_0131310 [Pseudomonas fluorescens LMG 5329]|uniref:Uncharacterized protein n=1 Tax=Pseudomonas fluorescens LMG 5329 TaxID=1324332 RepID=A0A0A1YRS3_PSEFL|nr:hypothetical protein K814_0131310 [Pseudomonas fluorescens LMG 5329]
MYAKVVDRLLDYPPQEDSLLLAEGGLPGPAAFGQELSIWKWQLLAGSCLFQGSKRQPRRKRG